MHKFFKITTFALRKTLFLYFTNSQTKTNFIFKNDLLSSIVYEQVTKMLKCVVKICGTIWMNVIKKKNASCSVLVHTLENI